jgi:opacity protein-like surface antigen
MEYFMSRLAAVLVAALVTSASAQEPAALTPAPATSLTSGSDGGWSILARVGAYVPVMGDFNVYRPGLAIEAGLGRRFGQVLSLELGGFYTKTETGIPVVATVDAGTGIATQSTLEMGGLLATLRATWATGPVELYAGAGLGYYWIQQWEVVEGAFFGGGFLSHDHPVGAHGCAGVNVRVTPALHLSAELRYTYVEPLLFGQHQRADGLGLWAGLGYRF